MLETQVRSPPLEKEMETQLRYSCLGNLIDKGAWWAAVHEGHKRVGHERGTVAFAPGYAGANLK